MDETMIIPTSTKLITCDQNFISNSMPKNDIASSTAEEEGKIKDIINKKRREKRKVRVCVEPIPRVIASTLPTRSKMILMEHYTILDRKMRLMCKSVRGGRVP